MTGMIIYLMATLQMVGVDIEIILELKTKMVCIPIQMINEELLIFGDPLCSKSVVTY